MAHIAPEVGIVIISLAVLVGLFDCSAELPLSLSALEVSRMLAHRAHSFSSVPPTISSLGGYGGVTLVVTHGPRVAQLYHILVRHPSASDGESSGQRTRATHAAP